ncbi:MAG: TOMM precursor leader peptide-binding protein [Polyangia bacterium]
METRAAASGDALRTQPMVINPYVRVTYCSDSEVLVKHGSRSRFSQIVSDEGKTKLIGRLLRSARDQVTLTELEQQGVIKPTEMDDATKLASYLLDRQILIRPSDYLPHVYLAMQYGTHATAITDRTIGLIGAGPLGSRVARELARVQPKGIRLLDGRKLREVHRSCFDIDSALVQPGMLFQEAAAQDLRARGFTAATPVEGLLTDQRAMTDVLDACDLAVVALESYSPRTLHAVNEVALTLRKPWMSLYCDGSEALVGPIYVPHETACYSEFELQNEANVALRDDYLLHKETLLGVDLETAELALPPYLSMMSGWATAALLPFLASGRSFAVGRAVRIDFERVSVDYQDVLKLPRCPACMQRRSGYPRHLFL